MGEGNKANPPQPFEGIFSELDPSHAMELRARAVREQEANERAYFSINRKGDLAALGFGRNQQNAVSQNNPTLIIPIHDITGEIVSYQMRANRPRIKNGKAIKYETPFGSHLHLDIPNSADKRLSLSSSLTPLFITEGAFKVDAGCGLGLLTIGVFGVDGWRGRNAVDGLTVLTDWEHISLKDREVFLAFDSDYRHNRHVYNALTRFRRWLEGRGANVKIINLPAADDGAKMGLDDFIADRLHKGNSDDAIKQELINLAIADHPDFQGTTAVDCPYRINNGGIELIKETDTATSVVPLTNFVVRIIKNVSLDDGTGTFRSAFTLQSEFNGETRQFELSAAQFSGPMRWVVERVGLGAIVHPGREEHTRIAIQLLSVQDEVENIQAYEYIGWIRIEGQWLYLHAGGAISESGLNTDVSVLLPSELSRYDLPAPPDGEWLHRAIHASLSLLGVICDRVSFPLLAATYRAVLGDTDFSLHTVGESGGGKSELNALALQHFGKMFTAKKLPESWTSTANAIETKAFIVKDALLVVDDFVPRGSSVEVLRLQDKAERIFRGQGNQQGRSRLYSDGHLRPTKYPRGLVLSTGEDVPRGQSLRARMLITEVAKHQGENLINWTALTQAQGFASDGLFAESMAAFIRWVAAQYDDLQEERHRLFLQLRELATIDHQHRRLHELIANLMIGIGFFLRFTVNVKALTAAQACGLLTRAWKAFGKAALEQGHFLNESESTSLFRRMLGAALAGGSAHVALDDGTAPDIELGDNTVIEPRSWGWRREDTKTCYPQGQRIGWLSSDGKNLYLEPELSLAVARKFAADIGEHLTVSRTELFKRLFERGLLLSRDTNRETYLVRKVVEGRRRNLLHTDAQSFLEGFQVENTPDQPDQSQSIKATAEDRVADLVKQILALPTTYPTSTTGEIGSQLSLLSSVDEENSSGRANGHTLGEENKLLGSAKDNGVTDFDGVVGLVGKNHSRSPLGNEGEVSTAVPKRKQVRI